MSPSFPLTRTVLAAAIVAAFALCSVSEVLAQSPQDRAAERRARHAERAGKTEARADEAAYPKATRTDPGLKASSKLGPKLQKLFKAYENDDVAEAQPLADDLLADASANAYEQAIAARLMGSMLLGTDDARALDYLQRAVAVNGLANNEHFETMLIVGQLQLQDEAYAQALSTIDRFLSETGSEQPEHQVLKGNALYRLERYPEAIAVLKPAIEASPEPRADWTQLLMAAYAEAGQPEEASKLAAQIAAKTPGDKRAQTNLAAVYMQSGQTDKALEVYERLRASGQFTEDRDYRNLYALYLNTDGKEQQAIATINEGLEKGVLKPDYQTYVALAQANYFSGNVEPALDAYRKAAPLAPDGETYLNMAKVLANEGRDAEAKAAAQQALDKGLKDPQQARQILAR